MEIIKKKILLSDVLSLANKGNKLTPFDSVEDKWTPNTLGIENTYLKPVMDIKNPVYLKTFEVGGYETLMGVSVLEYLSYQDLKRFYKDLLPFQILSEQSCRICEEVPPINFIHNYIELTENYMLYGGDELLINIVDILNIKRDVKVIINNKTALREKYFSYYEKDNVLFINYVLNKESEFTGKEVSLNTLFNNDKGVIKDFLIEYFYSDDKIRLLSELLFENVKVINTNLNNNQDQQKYIFSERYIKYTIDYFNQRNCEKKEVLLNNKFNDTKIPNIKFNILLTEQYNDLGIYTDAIEEWIPGRVYNIGNIVMFEGESYILAKGDNNSTTYKGNYNGNEKLSFFDTTEDSRNTGMVIRYVRYDGNTIDENGVDFEHWKRTVRPNKTPIYKTVNARIDSQLVTLKSYRTDENSKNFFDVEGKYKKGVKFNQVHYEIGVNSIGQPIYREYYSVIEDIKYLTVETGHDVVEYHYTIDKCNIDKENSGIKCVDKYHRFKINNTGIDENDYTYQFEESSFDQSNFYKYNNILSDVEFKIEAINNIDNVNPEIINYLGENSNLKVNVHNKSNENIYNYNNVIRDEYLTGIMWNPIVEDDVFIDRGINYAQSKHLQLQECKTLDDLMNYQNGNLNVKKQ
ncbi:MAG: hypothetical protein M0R03_08940 [Novosphingobium sp.]|nr:hypothetical protein [Novosphingobium sp.]